VPGKREEETGGGYRGNGEDECATKNKGETNRERGGDRCMGRKRTERKTRLEEESKGRGRVKKGLVMVGNTNRERKRSERNGGSMKDT